MSSLPRWNNKNLAGHLSLPNVQRFSFQNFSFWFQAASDVRKQKTVARSFHFLREDVRQNEVASAITRSRHFWLDFAKEFGSFDKVVAQNPLRDCIPGALSDRQMKRLFSRRLITGVQNDQERIDYSSVDLTLADEGYEMRSGSVKPFGSHDEGPYGVHVLGDRQFAKPITGVGGIYSLDPRKTYVFRLEQKLDASRLRKQRIFGQATAKSSVGRVDVLARLIVDGMNSYEEFDPDGLEHSNGDLFLEITSMTFNVRVKVGHPLNQLRLFYGEPHRAEIRGSELYNNVLNPGEPGKMDGSLSVDLEPVPTGGIDASAFCARKQTKTSSNCIDLWKDDCVDPLDFWNIELAKMGEQSGLRTLKIQKNAFYILRSREKIRLPKNVAVYCRAIDETIGEMRIHYAGFVHPFFGENRRDRKLGTPLIFEVRGHDVNVALTHGERMARLTFYRMSEDCRINRKRKSRKKHGAKSNKKNQYNEQELKLSGFFRSWPRRLTRNRKGKLVKAKPRKRRK